MYILGSSILHVFWSFWDLPISKKSRTIGNWHAQNFENCSLSSIGRLIFWIYAWLGLFALDCAYVRPKLWPCFLLQIALRYWQCSLFLILITILDICSKAPKVKTPGILYIYVYSSIYTRYVFVYVQKWELATTTEMLPETREASKQNCGPCLQDIPRIGTPTCH